MRNEKRAEQLLGALFVSSGALGLN